MKHLVFGSKSLLTGEEAADLLGQYAALLGKLASADYIELQCIDSLGNETIAGFLLNGGANLVVETASTRIDEPVNDDAVAYMRRQLDSYSPVPIDFRWHPGVAGGGAESTEDQPARPGE